MGSPSDGSFNCICILRRPCFYRYAFPGVRSFRIYQSPLSFANPIEKARFRALFTVFSDLPTRKCRRIRARRVAPRREKSIVATTRESHERGACISPRSPRGLSRFHVEHCGRCIILTLVVISGLPTSRCWPIPLTLLSSTRDLPSINELPEPRSNTILGPTFSPRAFHRNLVLHLFFGLCLYCNYGGASLSSSNSLIRLSLPIIQTRSDLGKRRIDVPPSLGNSHYRRRLVPRHVRINGVLL